MISTQNKHVFIAAWLLTGPALAGPIPDWVLSSQSTANSTVVVCSSDALDPENARIAAEARCLASAAKLNGAQVRITTKTVDSLTGADSSETAEVIPLSSEAKCDFTNRYLESLSPGYRVWLRCKVGKTTSRESALGADQRTKAREPASSKRTINVKRGRLLIFSSPPADKILVYGYTTRVFDGTENPLSIEINEGDQKVEVKKQRFAPQTQEISDWNHKQQVELNFSLEEDI